MARPSHYSNAWPAQVRRHFGLTQHELARYLGVSRQQVAAVEAGTNNFSQGPANRLTQLGRHLPPPESNGPPAPAFDAADPALPPDLAALRRRWRVCHVRALQLGLALDIQAKPAAWQARRRWAVAVLGPLLAAPWPTDGADPLINLLAMWHEQGKPGATPDPARDARWLADVALGAAITPVALTPTARALGLARLRGLEAEAAALAELLGEDATGPAPAGG